MRHRVRTRQVILGDDHARRFAGGPRIGLQGVGPLSGAQVDCAEILAERDLCRGRRADAPAELRLRARGRAALRPGGHALDDLRQLCCVIERIGNALERVAGDATVERFFALLGAGEALQPLAVRQLTGQILGLDEVQIEGGGLLHCHLHRRGARQLISHGPDGHGIFAGFQSTARETVLTLGIADDGDGHRGARPLRADEHALHRALLVRGHLACQRRWRWSLGSCWAGEQ